MRSSLRSHSSLVYLDDFIVYSRTVDDRARHLWKVLLLLKNASFSLKPCKCHFSLREVDFLGRIVRPEKLLVNQ